MYILFVSCFAFSSLLAQFNAGWIKTGSIGMVRKICVERAETIRAQGGGSGRSSDGVGTGRAAGGG